MSAKRQPIACAYVVSRGELSGAGWHVVCLACLTVLARKARAPMAPIGRHRCRLSNVAKGGLR